MNALEIHDLCKTYPDFTLDHLNLTLPSGCIMGLIGENGAGKSTTIKLILDMIRRDSGTITLLGRDPQQQPRLTREEIGVVLDEVGLPSCLTAKQIGKIMAHTFGNWDRQVYAQLLETLSLPADKPFKAFSKGMKMKLGIAVALSHHAKLLLLDEATSGLDPLVRDEVMNLLLDFTREEDHSVLISSHIVSDLEKICDYIAFLHQGKLLLCQEKDLLREQYALLYTTDQQLRTLHPEAVHGTRMSPYGVEALVERASVPADLPLRPVDLEELFILMVKEEV